MATLCLLGDDGAMTERWEIGARPVAIGRDDSADVRINDESLSRRHFLIVREGESYLLQDLDSQNGTWVDGRPARTVKLRHHDCIAAGRTLFLFSERCLSSRAPNTGSVAGSFSRAPLQTPNSDHQQNPLPSPRRPLL